MVGSAARGRPPRTASRWIAVLAAGPLGLGLVELGMRCFDLGPPPPFESEGSLFRGTQIEGLRFEHAPGALQRISYRERIGAEPRVVEMRVNDQGFRGRTVAIEKPPGTLRIACVGDSHTFGFGVGEGESWPDALARELAGRHPDLALEVMNCGVNNYDTVQEVLFLEHRVLPYEPDLVLLQFYVNDAAVHGAQRLSRRRPDALMRWTDPARPGLLTSLRGYSRFVDLACDWTYRRRGLAHYAPERTALFDESEPGWQMVRRSLARARDLCRERELPFALALYPFLVRDGRTLGSHRAFRIVQDFCAAESIPCIDAEPAFLREDVDSLRISPHDYHGSPEANRVFAAAVLEELEALGLLAEAARRVPR